MADGAATPSATISNIQVLRAFAAFAVVLLHLQPMMQVLWGVSMPAAWGAAGVDIFFVVSGFIMVHTNQGLSRTAPQFWLDRIVRIVPLYWLLTFLMAALLLTGASPNGLHRIDADDLATSLFFLPNIRADGAPEPVVSLGWTLNYEMFFYAVFGLTLFMRSMDRSVFVLAVLFGGLAAAGILFELPFAGEFYTRSIILEFVAGAALALVFGRGWLKMIAVPLLAGYALVLGGAAALLATILYPDDGTVVAVWRVIFYGVPSLMIVAGALILHESGHRWGGRFLLAQGAASYSLYLIHPLAMQPVAKIMAAIGNHPIVASWLEILPDGSHPWVWGAAMAVACITAALLTGYLLHRFVEAPLLAWLKRRLRPRSDGKLALQPVRAAA